MASAEHTASLPPIIEDESDENLLPMFYQKELERKEYRSQEKSSPRSNASNSEINESQLPYNSWKAKNRIFSRSAESGLSPDMVSRLGQSLESCHSVVPGRGQNGFRATNSSNGAYFHDNGNYKTHEMNGQTEQAFTNSNNAEYKRYLHSNQDVLNNPPMFDPNFSQNTSPGIYGKSVAGYPGYVLNGNKSQFSPVENPAYHMQSTIPFEHSNMPPTSFKHSSTMNSPPGFHQFRAGFHSDNHNYEKSPFCQGICCQSKFNTYMGSVVSSSDRPRLNQMNESPVSLRNSNSMKTSTCHCCHGDLDVKLNKKKASKIEKNRTKQINDLYKTVYMQNELLIQLQNEVKKLIEYNVKNEEKNQKICEQEHATKKQSKSTMEKRMFNLQVIEENKNLMEKISVGIMTSFIDTTSVTKNNGKDKPIRKKKEVDSNSSDSCSSEGSESGSCRESETSSAEERERRNALMQKKKGNKKYKSIKPIEESMVLNRLDIPTFAENVPSPNGSLHIDMQDYGSSSTSDTSDVSDSEEDDAPAPVGWTFYDKVVGKVNNMLSKSESEAEESENEIRNKTLEQLRRLGVSMEDSPTSKRVTFNGAAYIPKQQKLFLGESDTSMKMNALALKYLQEDKINGEMPSNGSDKCASAQATNTNLSLATLRYLEKYHLMPRVASNSPEVKTEKPRKKKEKKREEKKTRGKKSKINENSGKILDITAIKQQPKLLPKNSGK